MNMGHIDLYADDNIKFRHLHFELGRRGHIIIHLQGWMGHISIHLQGGRGQISIHLQFLTQKFSFSVAFWDNFSYLR